MGCGKHPAVTRAGGQGPKAPSTTSRNDHPFAPTEFPKVWSAAGSIGPVRASTDCDMHASGGGYRGPITSEDGYRLGLTPECLKRNGSHQPTVHRLHLCPLARASRTSGPSSAAF